VNNLCSFTGDANVVITVTQVNAQRGGIVLKNPDDPVTDNLPVSLEIPCDEGIPHCWDCPGQPSGDATGDGKVTAFDLLALRKAWLTTAAGSPHGTGTGEYNCCADFTQDGKVTSFDLLRLTQNWLSTGLGTCPENYCD
jgi:hypothetical protein